MRADTKEGRALTERLQIDIIGGRVTRTPKHSSLAVKDANIEIQGDWRKPYIQHGQV